MLSPNPRAVGDARPYGKQGRIVEDGRGQSPSPTDNYGRMIHGCDKSQTWGAAVFYVYMTY